MPTYVPILFFLAIIVSIFFAFLLVRFAKSSSRIVPVDNVPDEKSKEQGSPNSESKPVYEKIKELTQTEADGNELAKKITHIFDDELEKKIDAHTRDLSKKYEAIIKEKVHSEEIVLKKYHKVSDDKKKTEAVIRSIAEGLVVVDASGKVIMMNPAAEKLLGVSKKDKIGKSVTSEVGDSRLISLAHDTGREDKEIEVNAQDETKKVLRASSAVIEDENGQTVGMVSVLSDITKQKELDRLKSTFVANVTHELRTPFVAIDKSISLILGGSAGEISKTQEEFLSIAQRNIKRLSLLINDLLDLSKLEAAKMEIKCEPHSIEKIIRESVEGLSSWANTKFIKIEIKVQEAIPEVNVDSNRIIQVLNNLIGNAIKFTPKNGNISLEAVFHKEKNEAVVSVKDSGIGIKKENLEKIFDKFYQVGERAFTDVNGTGIGLSIAKEIVQLHGGKIWAESDRSSGAKFYFTLPLSL